MRFVWGSSSDIGRSRQTNQDNFAADRDLWIVADGMGGHSGGEIAAEIAVTTLTAHGPKNSTVELIAAVRDANTAIMRRADADHRLKGMGTTVCLLGHVLVDGQDRLSIANVGDSRIYVYANDELHQLTEDHSLVEQLLRDGRITPDEAERHPQRNVLTRALGIDATTEIDAWEILPFAGDRYVLCSDGLTNELTDDQIAAVLRRLSGAQDAASELVRLANANGGRDNITVVVVDAVEQSGVAPSGVQAASGHIVKVRVWDPGPAAQATAAAPVVSVAVTDDGDGLDDGNGSAAAPASAAENNRSPMDGFEAGDTIVVRVPSSSEAARPEASGSGLGVAASEQPAAAADIASTVADPKAAKSGRKVTKADHARREIREPRPPIFTVRLVVFLFSLLLVVLVAFGAVFWIARRTYYVRFDESGQVAIYRGRPGGVLWLDPELAETTEVNRSAVPAAVVATLESGHDVSSLADARTYVDNLRTQIAADAAARLALTATTTTTTSTTTTIVRTITIDAPTLPTVTATATATGPPASTR